MLKGLETKEHHAVKMFDNLVQNMSRELRIIQTYERQTVEVPQWMK